MRLNSQFCLAVVLLVCSYAHARCPRAYKSVGGLCLKAFTDRMNWVDAQQVCRGYNDGYLANILNSKDQLAVSEVYWGIKEQCVEDGVRYVYLGGLVYDGQPFWFNRAPKRSFDPDNYEYPRANKAAYTNWAHLQPDNFKGRERCINMLHTKTWNDVECDKEICFICQTDHI